MQVTRIEFHVAGSLWHGGAVSMRGHRYEFGYRSGRLLWCHKQMPHEGEGTLWAVCGSRWPRALVEAVRASVAGRQNLRPA